MYIIPIILGMFWVITTSATTLQVINLGDYVPTILKWIMGITQIIVTAAYIWVIKNINASKDFILIQTNKNIETEKILTANTKHLEETHKLANDVHVLVAELKGMLKDKK